MPIPPPPDDDVKIIPPDRTLQAKLGVAKLDQLFSADAVHSAQQVIVSAADRFYEECLNDVKDFARASQGIAGTPEQVQEALRNLSALTFSLKAKAGLGGYDLISLVAKSLYQLCEQWRETPEPQINGQLVKWHIESLRKLLDLKVKGSGGPTGAAILAEIEKLVIKAGQPEFPE